MYKKGITQKKGTVKPDKLVSVRRSQVLNRLEVVMKATVIFLHDHVHTKQYL